MRTSGLDTSSSCRTTARVIKSVCSVSGTFLARFHPGEVIEHIHQDSPAAPIQLGHWQGFSSRYAAGIAMLRLKLKVAFRSGFYPGTTKSRSRLRIGSTNGRTHSDANLQLATSELSALQSQSTLLEYGNACRYIPMQSVF